MEVNNQMNRRQFLRLSSMVGAGALIAACAPAAAPAAQPAASSGGGDAAAPAPAGETVKIQYQSREPEMAGGVQQLWDEWYPKFRETNPGIEIEFLPDPGGNEKEVAMTSMVAGTAADLLEFCCFNSTYFMQEGQATDLQPMIDRDAEEVKIDDYYAHQFDPWKKDGDIHLMPRFTGTQVVYYNKDWFEKAGVEAPTQEWGKWDYKKYEEIGAKFVATDPLQTWATSNYGLSGGASWLAQYWLRGWGTHMVNPNDDTECLLSSKEAQECLEWLRSMIWDKKEYVPGGSEMAGGVGPDALFIAERIPMMEIGPWNLGVVMDGAQFKWDVAPMPNGPAGITTHQSVDGTMIWKGSKNAEQAWTVLKGTTSPEYGLLYAKYANKQPSRKSILDEFPKVLRDYNEKYNDIKLEVFTDAIKQDLGGPEEMFKKDDACKNQILKPAFDRVMVIGDAQVDLIARHGDLATKFNRDEVKLEDLGAEMEKIK
ncbi:MAG: extracellular solute-binding protein [Caldilineaceae bacterium]